MGKWAESPQSLIFPHFFVPTFVFKTGHLPTFFGHFSILSAPFFPVAQTKPGRAHFFQTKLATKITRLRLLCSAIFPLQNAPDIWPAASERSSEKSLPANILKRPRSPPDTRPRLQAPSPGAPDSGHAPETDASSGCPWPRPLRRLGPSDPGSI